ncbi:putative dinucleotide-binding enzyme [Methanonatronarchaeum thermophilum]|uniref:Putative dinucleotide-binding enzyme n=1 Tax=Methanonatronarchaeum thermophilum TaxID=1927129 RepID=A0A1Y3GCC2_9EURY|nr:NADPH-dependent F420 reductase [Methanonatronarchaeum thermophilum]OUJ19101.1 putative dinucleotide-binding enzyme [Methanonatronarchaeum thermophilum]
MKIGFVGGTGHIGKGLALRWGKGSNHEIFIGSRNESRGREAAEEYSRLLDEAGYEHEISGGDNRFAVENSDVVLVCIPYKSVFETMESLSSVFDDQVLISPVVPMFKSEGQFGCDDCCAALDIDNATPEGVRVVSAFHTVPAKPLYEFDNPLECDVIVCGENDAKMVVFDLIDDIDGMRGLDGGDLSVSRLTEAVTPLLLNVSINNDISHPMIKFISP